MNTLLRNFFYAVGVTILFALYGLDAGNAQFADLVRLAQSPMALKMVLALMALFIGLDFVWGAASGRRSSIRAFSGSASSKELLNGVVRPSGN